MIATDEIADGVYRFSTYVPDPPPRGMTFNQFLLVDDAPVLVHTGMRTHFAELLDAVTRIMPPARLRWITSNHASRPDELGALDEWFAAAPQASVVHGEVACRVSLAEITDGRRRAMPDAGVLDTGRMRLRWMATPHVPGPWEAGFWYEETGGVLFTGDVFAHAGATPAITADDVVEAAVAHDNRGGGTALTPNTGPTLHRLADLAPAALALMHGSTFVGDCDGALRSLAKHFDARLRAELTRVSPNPTDISATRLPG